MKLERCYLSVLSMAVSALTMSPAAWALDVDPYTYFQLPSGQSSLVLANTVAESNNFRYSGTNARYTQAGAANNSHLTSDNAIAHYTGFYEVDGVMVDPHVVIPYATANHARLGGTDLDGDTGWANPLLALVIAPIHNADNSRVLGVGLASYVPMGHYQPAKSIGVSDHRWREIVQITGIHDIAPQWSASFTFDTTFYGDNPNGGLTGSQRVTQQNSYQFQPWLRYQPVPAFSVALGYSQTFGGKQYLDNVEDGIECNNRQIRIDLAGALSERMFLGLQLARDMVTDGGYRESFVMINRFTILF